MKHLSIMLSAADYCFVDQSDMLRLIDWHIQLLESKSKLSNIIVGGGGGGECVRGRKANTNIGGMGME